MWSSGDGRLVVVSDTCRNSLFRTLCGSGEPLHVVRPSLISWSACLWECERIHSVLDAGGDARPRSLAILQFRALTMASIAQMNVSALCTHRTCLHSLVESFFLFLDSCFLRNSSSSMASHVTAAEHRPCSSTHTNKFTR